MLIKMQKSKDGYEGYISTYTNHENTKAPLVCKPVGSAEFDEVLEEFKNNSKLKIEEPELPIGEEHIFLITEL